MSAMASQITGVSIVCSTVCLCANQRKHQSSASLTFARGIHRWPVDSPHKGPVTRKMFPFDDVIIHVYRNPCFSSYVLSFSHHLATRFLGRDSQSKHIRDFGLTEDTPSLDRTVWLLGVYCKQMYLEVKYPENSRDMPNALQWRHNGRDSVSNHQPHECLPTVYSDADQRKHQSSASLAFVRGLHRRLVNSPHKCPVARKMFPFHDVIMVTIAAPRWLRLFCDL